MRGLLGIEALTREEIQAILDRARDFQLKPVLRRQVNARSWKTEIDDADQRMPWPGILHIIVQLPDRLQFND